MIGIGFLRHSKRSALYVVRLIMYVIGPVLTRLLSLGFRRDRKLILFGALGGALYADNTMHLYEWMLKNRPDLHVVWLTKSVSVYNELRSEGKSVELTTRWRGFRLLFKARVGCFTHGLRDLASNVFWVPDSMQLIALRHGRSVKRVRFAIRQGLSRSEVLERKREAKLTRYGISTSEFISDIQEECVQIGRDKHTVTGYPRNDGLLCPSDDAAISWEEYLDGLRPTKVVLYAPTWRHGREATRFFPFGDFDETELGEFLEEHNTLLLLRPHVADYWQYTELRDFITRLAQGCLMVKLSTQDEFPDVNTIMPFVDVLITDYSAIYHDFLLLDRPLVFIPYDFKGFELDSGFLYNYHRLLPGPTVDSFASFKDTLRSALSGVDSHKQKRKYLQKKIHVYQDAAACERIVQLIDSLL